MMREFKVSLKMLRYAYGVKSSAAFSVLFLILGLAMSLMPKNFGNIWMGSYLVMTVAMWPIQMHYSLGASNMVLASPMRKSLQTKATVLLNALFFFLVYMLVLLVKLLQITANMRGANEIQMELLLDAVLIICIMVFNGVSYKLFVVSTVLFIGAVMCISGVVAIMQFGQITVQIPVWAAVLSGFAAIIVGGLLQYGLTLLFDKYPISKNAQMAGLRKQL